MLYLFLAILCSASIALIFKYTENGKTNRYLITSANYFMAFSVSLIMLVSQGVLKDLVIETSFREEFKLLSKGHVFSASSSIVWALIIGVMAGFFFFYSFIYYQKSVKENGVAISGALAKLGILIPMIFSVILWKEIPTKLQWLGIMIALLSIVLLNLSKDSMKGIDFKASMLLLFLFGGMAEFSNKIFQKYALSSYKDVFLFTVFFVAFLISLYFTKREKKKISIKDILTGFAVGVPNLFSSYFLILSLESLATSVAFPIYSAGSIVFINLGGYLIFKEKIDAKTSVAIALTLFALILINL